MSKTMVSKRPSAQKASGNCATGTGQTLAWGHTATSAEAENAANNLHCACTFVIIAWEEKGQQYFRISGWKNGPVSLINVEAALLEKERGWRRKEIHIIHSPEAGSALELQALINLIVALN